MVAAGACVAIVAGNFGSDVQAPRTRRTGVRGADVAIVAIHCLPSLADPGLAHIPCGADVAVLAVRVVRRIGTPARHLAGIIGAGVSIITVDGQTALAIARQAALCDGARVFIVTQLAVVQGLRETLPGSCVAGHCIAFCRRSRQWVTFDHGLTCDAALIGQGGRIAVQGSVAQIVIFERGTVGIFQAITLHGKTAALALIALVGNGARVAVVTVGTVEGKGAAAQSVAGIVCARVTVVAIYGCADALPFLAMVTNGARIAIDTLAGLEALLLATTGAQASINGTGIVVIAQIDQVATFRIRLVDVSVTVVVQTIAALGDSFRGLAFSEPLLGADSLAVTGAELGGSAAGRPQSQFDRFAATRTNPCIGHALQRTDPIDCDCRQT